MKEVWKVYIKGASEGNKVIKKLMDLGAKNPYKYVGSDLSRTYYIGHDGNIHLLPLNTELTQVIIDNYQEIKLPEWEDGDILINLKTKDFAVYRKDDDFRKESFRDEVYVKNDGIIIFRNYLHRNDDFSLATDEETQQFYELLHKQGKDWDVKNKQLVDWKWKPECGENYFYVTSLGEVKESMLDQEGVKTVLDFGNYFCTKEEAEAMAEKIKNLLKDNL